MRNGFLASMAAIVAVGLGISFGYDASGALNSIQRELGLGEYGEPVLVIFVADAEAIELDQLGPRLEHHGLFPERANIGVAQVTGPDILRLRVWERGVGLTKACGSGACAAAVAACRRGLAGRRVQVVLDGGPLELQWRDDGHVVMTGPVATAFSGTLGPELLP